MINESSILPTLRALFSLFGKLLLMQTSTESNIHNFISALNFNFHLHTMNDISLKCRNIFKSICTVNARFYACCSYKIFGCMNNCV